VEDDIKCKQKTMRLDTGKTGRNGDRSGISSKRRSSEWRPRK